MAKFPETFAWATQTDIRPIRTVIQSASQLPLRAIGSGGSLTTAHALCYFHQLYTRQIAAVATPIEAICDPLNSGVSHWLLSAGGNNVDVLAAARILIRREPCQIAVLCGRVESRLEMLCRAHPFADFLLFPTPTGKDGFLATNSLLGFTALIARAYMEEFDSKEQWKVTAGLVRTTVSPLSRISEEWQRQTIPLWKRPTTLVLYGPSTRIGAIDLESKFTEAAIGNIQIADYRNFAHGRHHWLAKCGQFSAVMAFVTDADRPLAERTLDLIPAEIPQARLTLPGNSSASALLSLVAALKICGWAGKSRGIDPGRPGVPEFGRKLYRLALPSAQESLEKRLPARDLAAISRKSGMPLDRLRDTGELVHWKTCLDTFRTRLLNRRFAGVVLDYDGTLIEARDRLRPPKYEVGKELVRLLEEGAWIGIATGRGASVRRDLQTCLPCSLWKRVIVGYYNGAEIAELCDDDVPDSGETPCDSLTSIAAAFRSTPELSRWVKQTDRRFQITLEPTHTRSLNRFWEIVLQIFMAIEASDLRVFRSSHSIDVVAGGVSKTNVLNKLRGKVGSTPLLAIGDQGRWPGNDFELLRGPYSLSVNECSTDPETCWNLAQPGQRGPIVAVDYISRLKSANGDFCFEARALQ